MYHIPKMGDEHSQYDGSRIFSWLAEICGLSVDLINFLVCQVLAVFLASLFRSFLHQKKVTSDVRHVFGLVLGLCFGYFCFGQQAIHIAGLPAVCYIVIRTQNPHIVQRIVMVVALAYLSCIHLHRQYYDYGSYSLDITGPLMIITQKVTSLAFSIHDGFTREEKDLTKSQKVHAINKVPSALEYFSYVLHFQSLMAGPFVFYKDYIDFIEGYQFLKHAPGTNGNLDKNFNAKEIVVEPSPTKVVIKKVISSGICAYIFIKLIPVYPIKTIKDDDFIRATSFGYKLWYLIMATTVIRFKYYHAWLLADAICNNSGLGFNGYDKDGVGKWDLISNIKIGAFEFALNFRDSVNAWNMGTNRWLRTIVYERVPKNYGTILTFSLSALWHGFYPGYYVTFATGALIVMAARMARKLFHHHFQSTKLSRALYDVITCLTTRVFMGYTTFPFVLLEFQASLRLYLNIFMCLHLVAFVTIFILPKLLRGDKWPNSNNINNNKITNSTCMTNDNDIINNIKPGDNNIKISSNLPDKNELLIVNNNNYYNKNSKNHNDDNLINNLAENVEEFFDKTVTGIVELKDDLMRMNGMNEIFINSEGLRKRTNNNQQNIMDGLYNGGDNFLKKEIDALNAAVQQANVLPAVLSNGHAK